MAQGDQLPSYHGACVQVTVLLNNDPTVPEWWCWHFGCATRKLGSAPFEGNGGSSRSIRREEHRMLRQE